MYTSLILLSLVALPSSLAAPAPPQPTALTKRAITPVYDGSVVNGRTYDYVIAGGGLTGVVLAKRLSEDGTKTVLVIEAGYDEEGRQGVYDTSMYQRTFGTFLDWQYQTVPQSAANNQPQTVRAGRALGGSTCINGMAWSKPHDFQIDAMEQLGNSGLNWASLQTYMLKAENFQAPSSSQVQAGVTYNPSCHSSNGPIGVQYDPNGSPSSFEHDLNSTYSSLGLPYANDLTCGKPAGLSPIANTRSGNTRIDAYRGYLYGQTIPNLTILSGANVGRIQLSNDATPRASGVEFQDEKGNPWAVFASLEVIMATGSLKTPAILQQSGIGPNNVLSSAGVTQMVDLPIGLNLIDQTTSTTSYNFNGNAGGDQPIIFPRFQDLFSGSEVSRMTNMLQNNLASYAQAAVSAGAAYSAAGLQKVLEIQRDWILNKGVGFSENFDYTFGSTLGYDSWYLLPFGRGSVKITDNQPYSTNNIAIDPRFFSNEFDRLAQGATARLTGRGSTTSPLDNSVSGKSGSQPDGTDLDQWSTWVQNNYRSNWHPIGTVAMMSKDLGGSVDSRNKVYGVNGLRVVDASTLPFQVSSHLMSVLYGLSERAAELIKADHSGSTSSSSVSSSTTSPSSSSSPRPSSSSASRSSTSSSSASPTSPPAASGTAIHPNGDNSKCLEIRGTSYSNGVLVDINDCNGNANQKWIINRDTTTVKVAGTNYCLDAGNSPGNGVQSKIWTASCINNIPAQTWYYTADNRIAVKDKGQCLDLTNGSNANGNIMQTYECSTGNNNQVWTT